MSARLDRLRTRARLEAPAPLTAGAMTFVDAGPVWAVLAERQSADLRTQARFYIRMRRDVAPGWRLRVGLERLRIVATTTADPAWLEIFCERDFT